MDTGIGMLDIADPMGRIGADAVSGAGFQFLEQATAVGKLRQRGLSALGVTHIVLTHADPDHAGGLSDFPNAHVHLSVAELRNIRVRVRMAAVTVWAATRAVSPIRRRR